MFRALFAATWLLAGCGGSKPGPTDDTTPPSTSITGFNPIGVWHVDAFRFWDVATLPSEETGDTGYVFSTYSTTYGYPYTTYPAGTAVEDLFLIIRADASWVMQQKTDFATAPDQSTVATALGWVKTAEREVTLDFGEGDEVVCVAPVSDDLMDCQLLSPKRGGHIGDYILSRVVN